MEWIMRYWIEALFGCLIGGMGVVMRCFHKKLKVKSAENDAVKEALRALLKDRIIQAYNHYVDQEHCPIYGKDNIQDMYTQYHALGGNGTVTKLVETIMSLPTPKKEDK